MQHDKGVIVKVSESVTLHLFIQTVNRQSSLLLQCFVSTHALMLVHGNNKPLNLRRGVVTHIKSSPIERQLWIAACSPGTSDSS